MLRHTVAIKSTPLKAPYIWEGTPNFQFLNEEERFWTTHLTPQLLSLPFEGVAPKSPSSESQWGFVSFLERYKLPKLTQKEIKNLNIPIKRE